MQVEKTLEVKTCKKLWRNYAQKNVKAIVWKALNEKLPTKMEFQQKGILMANNT